MELNIVGLYSVQKIEGGEFRYVVVRAHMDSLDSEPETITVALFKSPADAKHFAMAKSIEQMMEAGVSPEDWVPVLAQLSQDIKEMIGL